MTGLIAVTDFDWFEFLRAQGPLEEVNFWRPSDTRTPQQLRPGMPVLPKLRKKFGGWIVGWGQFARHDVLPAWLAWDAFEVRNGAPTFAAMRSRIERLRHDSSEAALSGGDYRIGCLMLSDPVFFERPAWISPPANWPENVVQGKAYDLAHGEGLRIWIACQAATTPSSVLADRPAAPAPTEGRFGAPFWSRPRLGQGTFRIAVTRAYGNACAVTSEHSLPALEAAHIRSYSEGGPHEISNGLLLRSDLHRLYDKGYVAITADHRFVVSKRLRQDFENGRSYYPLDGQLVRLPSATENHPDPVHVGWHLSERFRG